MTTATTSAMSSEASSTDPLQLIDVDHVRFLVGNAKQAAFFYAHTFGFQVFGQLPNTGIFRLLPIEDYHNPEPEELLGEPARR